MYVMLYLRGSKDKILLLILLWIQSLKRSASSFCFLRRCQRDSQAPLTTCHTNSHFSIWQNPQEKTNMTNKCSQKSVSPILQYLLWSLPCTHPSHPPGISLFSFSSNCLRYFKPKLSKSKLTGFFPQPWLPAPPDPSWDSTSVNGINSHFSSDTSKKGSHPHFLYSHHPNQPITENQPFCFPNISKSTHSSPLPLLPL